MIVQYQKRKNIDLFESLEKSDNLFLSKTQNYIPIYQRFFSLNKTNYNNINLNNKWHISNINNCVDDNENVFNCIITNTHNAKKNKHVPIFFKLAPLLDPYKFLIGKHELNDETIFQLPDIESNESYTHSKLLDKNNSAYVDSFFVYLSSQLFHEHRFIHGLDFYGSFLSIKKEYKINIIDDLDYLSESEFFNKNKNILFQVDEYDYLLESNNTKLKSLIIHSNKSLTSIQSIHTIDNDIFDNIFSEEGEKENDTTNANIELKELDIDYYKLEEDTNTNQLQLDNTTLVTTIKSNSTCSSRTSHTFSETADNIDNMCSYCETDINDHDHSHCDECNESDENIQTSCHETENEDENNIDNNESDTDTDSTEETVFVTFPKFPVHVICMENCEDTFDNLIIENELTNEEWLSAFMQIIMILITYQKTFSLTHNDLHTNNVMYITTNKKFIYYKYNKIYYKVPTFGRLFKIIDFGRAIYKFNNELFCSDSFKIGGDAAGQYNIEPYFNNNKPRLEPNYSFDLCRLACSIFDYVIEDMNELPEIIKDNIIAKLICEWCTDDNGVNILYKNNGDERYPDFKLYKMISRCVHNHTPQAQLKRPEFSQFAKFTFKKDSTQEIIDIDNIPCFV